VQELTCKFTPADGSPPRDITVRIGTPVHEDRHWFAAVEIEGFAHEREGVPIYGADWAQANEMAASILPVLLNSHVLQAGGGTVEPSFYKRKPSPWARVRHFFSPRA
jgi:hypothetical protein